MASATRTALVTLGVTTALAGVLYVTLPRPANVAGYLVAVVVVLGVAALPLRRMSGRARRSWQLVVAGLAAYVVADLVLTGRFALTGTPVPIGSPWHLLYPLGAALLAAGLLLAVDRGRERDLAVLIDALVATTSIGVVTWIVLVLPAAGQVAPTIIGQIQLVSYPLAHLLLLAAAVRLLLSDRRPVAARRLLGAGIALLLATVIALGALLAADRYALGGSFDLTWLVAYAVLAAAVAHPTAPVAVTRPPAEIRRLSVRRIAVLSATALLIPAVGYAIAARTSDRLLAAATLVVLGLVSLRVWLLLRELERSRDAALAAQRERERHRLETLVQHASDVLLVLDHERVAYATPSARQLFGANPTGWERSTLDGRFGRGGLSVEPVRPDPGRPRPEPTALELTDSAGQLRQVEVVAVDLRDDPDVRGTVVTLHEITERTALEQELRHLAFHDVLTGLSNRELLLDRLEQARARARRRPDAWFAVLACDLDDFKVVNDTLGHAAGDTLLIEVARRMTTQVRDMDTVARTGGDEFVVLCEELSGATEAGVTARRLLEAVRQPVTIDGHDLQVGCTIGVAVDDGSRSTDALLRDADLALYEAKAEGKQRWVLHQPAMTARVQARLQLATDLAEAIDQGTIGVVFQPVLSLATGLPTAIEALARWEHPSRGAVGPDEFIPVAESSGLIGELGALVLERALAALHGWDTLRPDLGLQVTVNVSSRQIRDAGLVRVVTRALRGSGVTADRLMLELSETAMHDETDQTQAIMHELHGRGVHLAIDDFGTGHSALAALHRLPVERIKVHRSFVAELGVDGGANDLVRAMVQLGRSLGLEVVAEGVETERQRALVDGMGCTHAQGYLFSRPVSDAALRAWLTALEGPAPRPTDPRRPVQVDHEAP